MAIRQQINQDFKQALKQKNVITVSTLRMIEGALKNAEIALRPQRKKLTEEEMLKVLSQEAKKHKDSIEAFTKGGREDLVLKEKQELEIIKKYLPEQLSEDGIKKVVKEVIEKMGEVSEKDFGRVMKEVMNGLKGRAEGGLVNKLVRESMKT